MVLVPAEGAGEYLALTPAMARVGRCHKSVLAGVRQLGRCVRQQPPKREQEHKESGWGQGVAQEPQSSPRRLDTFRSVEECLELAVLVYIMYHQAQCSGLLSSPSS